LTERFAFKSLLKLFFKERFVNHFLNRFNK